MYNINIKLTPKQEQFVLNSILTLTAIDGGASRVVYKCPHQVKEYLNLDSSREYVIKLCVGMAGYNQQNAEVAMYQDYGNEHLAEIVAIGCFVEIMEFVDVLDPELREFTSYIGDADDFCYEEFEKFIYRYSVDLDESYCPDTYDTISFLCDKLGWSGDNGQVGITDDGRIVAYDYGYDLGEGGTKCTGYTSSIQYQNKYQLYFLGRLYQFLEGKTDYLTSAEIKTAAREIENDLVYVVQVDHAKQEAQDKRERISILKEEYDKITNEVERGVFIGRNYCYFTGENGKYDFISIRTREIKREECC